MGEDKMENYTIRKMRVEELPALSQLFDYDDFDAMLAETAKAIKEKRRSIFVLHIGGRLVGELHVKHQSEDGLAAIPNQRAYLFAFRVHHEVQGRGWGTLLLTAVIAALEKEGVRELTIGVEDGNPRARRLYESLGFTKVIARITESYQNGDPYEYDLLLRS